MQSRASAKSAREPWLRRVLVFLVGASAVLAATTLWLLRNPRPHFDERRSPLASVVEGPTRESAGLLSQTVRLTASDGLTVDVSVRTPERDGQVASGREPGKRPLFLLLGGYRTGEDAAMLVDDTRGAVVAAMGYPYDGPIDISGLQIVWHLRQIRRAILDTPPAIQLALDYLLTHPEVDPERVELVGVSFGAFFAPVAAALDSRVTRLWLIHGAGDPRRVLEYGLRRSIPYALPRAAVAAVANVIFVGPRLAPERWLPRVAPRPVIMVSAADDRQLPSAAVETLHASAREPKEVIWVTGEHVHPNREDVIRRLMNVVLSRTAPSAPHRQ